MDFPIEGDIEWIPRTTWGSHRNRSRQAQERAPEREQVQERAPEREQAQERAPEREQAQEPVRERTRCLRRKTPYLSCVPLNQPVVVLDYAACHDHVPLNVHGGQGFEPRRLFCCAPW